jgi:hypothetical protein
MKTDVRKQFLVDRDNTGREIIKFLDTGKVYYVEYIGDGRMADWGSVNPATGKMENKKGAGKFNGSIKEEESLITKENGFDEIHEGKGAPYSKIIELHEKWKRENGL